MILAKQKSILTLGIVAFLIAVFFTGKNISTVYAAAEGEIFYHDRGYFKSNNGTLGGPGCGICLETGKGGCLKRPGTTGYFTKDSACKAAYGSNVIAGARIGGYVPVSMCGVVSTSFQIIECIIPRSSPCLEWKDGVCTKVNTSIFQGGNKNEGDISTEPAQFIVRILTIILSFAGGIAFLLILSAGYKIMTSKGKPEAIQQGRDQLISAIVGLVFIIFSFVIFQLVVVDIFKIPGFS